MIVRASKFGQTIGENAFLQTNSFLTLKLKLIVSENVIKSDRKAKVIPFFWREPLIIWSKIRECIYKGFLSIKVHIGLNLALRLLANSEIDFEGEAFRELNFIIKCGIRNKNIFSKSTI